MSRQPDPFEIRDTCRRQSLELERDIFERRKALRAVLDGTQWTPAQRRELARRAQAQYELAQQFYSQEADRHYRLMWPAPLPWWPGWLGGYNAWRRDQPPAVGEVAYKRACEALRHATMLEF